MCVYLRPKFEVSSINLTSFRQGEGNLTPPPTTSKQTPKKPNQIRVKKYTPTRKCSYFFVIFPAGANYYLKQSFITSN